MVPFMENSVENTVLLKNYHLESDFPFWLHHRLTWVILGISVFSLDLVLL